MIRSVPGIIAVSILLITPQTMASGNGRSSYPNCLHLATSAPELRDLDAAIAKAEAALKNIDFAQTSVSYAQGNAIARGPLNNAAKFLGYARTFISRAQSDPTLLFYWHAYSGSQQAARILRGASNSLELINAKDEQTSERIRVWQGGLDDSAGELDRAIDAFGETIETALKAADGCFGVTYESRNAGKKQNQ